MYLKSYSTNSDSEFVNYKFDWEKNGCLVFTDKAKAEAVGVSSETLFRRIDEGLIERGKLKGYEARRVVDDEHSDQI